MMESRCAQGYMIGLNGGCESRLILLGIQEREGAEYWAGLSWAWGLVKNGRVEWIGDSGTGLKSYGPYVIITVTL